MLAALDRLFARLGDTKALADVLERRIAVETEADTQADLLHRLAVLQIHEFGEHAQGLATLRQALERVPDHAASREALEGLLDDDALFEDAFDALEFVYRTLGRTEELAKLYERRVARAQSTRDRIRARLDLARVLEERWAIASRPARRRGGGRRGSVRRGLAGGARAARRGERRVARGGRGARGGARGRAGPARGDAQDLWVRLAEWRRDKLDDTRGRRTRSPGRSRSIRRTSTSCARSRTCGARRAASASSFTRCVRAPGWRPTSATKRDLFREAKALAEGPVADRDLAEATLRDLLAEDEADLWALEELTKLRGPPGDDGEVVKLLL